MKKLLCLMIAVTMLLSICPAAFADGERKTNDNVFNEAAVLSQLDVTTYETESGSERGIVFVIKNNSSFAIDIDVFAAFYDGEENLVYVDSDSASVVETGYSTVLAISSSYGYERVEYGLHAEETQGVPMRYNFACEDYASTGGVTLSVTNNNEFPTKNARATVLFFSGDKLVYADEEGVYDDDYEIKPGATLEEELKCRVPFDSYEVYLNAYTSEFSLSQYNENAPDAGEADTETEPEDATETGAETQPE